MEIDYPNIESGTVAKLLAESKDELAGDAGSGDKGPEELKLGFGVVDQLRQTGKVPQSQVTTEEPSESVVRKLVQYYNQKAQEGSQQGSKEKQHSAPSDSKFEMLRNASKAKEVGREVETAVDEECERKDFSLEEKLELEDCEAEIVDSSVDQWKLYELEVAQEAVVLNSAQNEDASVVVEEETPEKQLDGSLWYTRMNAHGETVPLVESSALPSELKKLILAPPPTTLAEEEAFMRDYWQKHSIFE